MTKIRNTKKGMAKKTLSISLAVAMLATSNVPVWAAEDLFTDGEVAVEAFTSEEVEAPVVEEVEEVVDAQAVDSTYTVDFKDFKSEVQWGTETPTFKVKVTDNLTGKKPATPMYYRILRNGVHNDGELNDQVLTFGTDGYATVKLEQFDKTEIGDTLQLQVYENIHYEWDAVSPAFTVIKKEINGTIDFYNDLYNKVKDIRYTGKQITSVPVGTVDGSILNFTDANIDRKDMVAENFTAVAGDTINSSAVSGKMVTAEGNIVSPYYTGKVTGDFWINRKLVETPDGAVTVDLPKYTYQYTGNPISVKGEDITVTNKLTEKAVDGAAGTYEIGTAVGTYKGANVPVDMKAGSLKNFANLNDDFFAVDANGYSKATAAQDVVITKRDLADTVNTKITVTTVTQDLLENSTIAAESLKNNLIITDANGDVVNNDEVELRFNGAESIYVEAGKTYSVTVRDKANDGKNNIIGERTVDFTVVAHDLGLAKFESELNGTFPIAKEFEYTGKQITYGLTAENLTDKLGELKIQTPDGRWIPLSKGFEYDTNIKFGENTNVGTATITIDGKAGYTGSQKVITFKITPRTVTQDHVVAPEKVLYKDSIRKAEEYGVTAGLVVKGENVVDELGNAIELTVPTTDYTVDQVFADDKGPGASNKVGAYVLSYINKANTASNFAFPKNYNLLGKTLISNKAIAEADVVMEKTEYAYAAKPIIPDYKVVVDGVTLEKGKDYTEVVIHNTDVGEATLTVTGRGDYDKTSVSKKFEIVPADVSALTVKAVDGVEYNGAQHVDKNELNVKLGDVEFDTANKAIKDQFDFYFPTSKLANINAGDAYVTLVPKKGNKNFVGEHEFTFTIGKALLFGNLRAYNAKGTEVDISAPVQYDGTAHTFAKTVFTPTGLTGKMKVTEDDYEVIYRDNVAGKEHGGHVLVIAKGNYTALGEYECADGSVVKDVALDRLFYINPIDLTKGAHTDVNVVNGTYAEGLVVKPDVTVTYQDKVLVEGIDYKLTFKDTDNRTEVTNGKVNELTVEGIGGYTGIIRYIKWGIDKFDLKDAEVVVSGTDADPVVKVFNRTVLVDPSNYELTVAEGKVTVTATENNKHYVGTQTADIKEALVKPETPMIANVEVYGNKATVVLSGESEGAIGYDYVIATDRDCITTKDYDKVNKNKLTTDTTFQYVDQGMYYAYCHAWTRDENGKKVFSEWSNAFPFSVTAITPSQPTITSVKQNGSTVTVTYSASKDAIGYDVVLGSAMATVNDERRPVEYGTYVKKNATTTTVTFKNVEKGTYYVGLHAYNRTAEDGKKVFSPWSVAKKLNVK